MAVRAYLVCVCQGSALDRDSNNFTLFNVVERVTVQNIPQEPIPFESHTYLEADPDDMNRSGELWPVWVGDGGQEHEAVLQAQRVPLNHPRMRVRLMGLRLPPAGHYRLVPRWRWDGDEQWERLAGFWPFEVVLAPLGLWPMALQ